MTPLERAIEAAGGVGALARAINVAPSAPSMWKSRGRVPAEHCSGIELASGNAVRRWELRPEDWHRIWPELVGIDGAPYVGPERRSQRNDLDSDCVSGIEATERRETSDAADLALEQRDRREVRDAS